MSRWDPKTKMITDEGRTVTQWDRKTHQIVQIQKKLPRPGTPGTRFSSRSSDNRSVTSTTSEPILAYRWSLKDSKVIVSNPSIARWDYVTNKPVRMKLRSRGGDGGGGSLSTSSKSKSKTKSEKISSSVSLPSKSIQIESSNLFDGISSSTSTIGSKSSPTTVLFDIQEDKDYTNLPLSSSLSSIRPSSAHRPYSADLASRKKRLRELKVQNMLNRLTQSDSSSIEFNEATKLHSKKQTESSEFMSLDLHNKVSHITKLNDKLNEKISRKDSLIEEQQRMIEDLATQVETLSRSDNNNVPKEVKVSNQDSKKDNDKKGENGEEKPDNKAENFFISQLFAPFFGKSDSNRAISPLTSTTDE
mmetsp:Transcript_1007/g.1388  ORF Transcript_1007/g.1388 Transcript_1007/m.1388 type:complete len:360 (+) Transcript_1007:56-1135(+)